MHIAKPGLDPVATLVNEVQLLQSKVALAGLSLIELGCGRAEKTRTLAESGAPRHILALEVDTIQHQRNLAITDLPTVSFVHGGAEAIPAADNSADLVLLFKSLHHVPVAQQDQALAEIARVLKPGGLAWISEPVFAGNMNEVIRLFHDEQQVREAAFAAIGRAVHGGRLQLVEQLFFHTRSHFDSFAQFDQRMIQVTHTDHQLDATLYHRVQDKFAAFCAADGSVTFLNPQRVDLLQKPGKVA